MKFRMMHLSIVMILVIALVSASAGFGAGTKGEDRFKDRHRGSPSWADDRTSAQRKRIRSGGQDGIRPD